MTVSADTTFTAILMNRIMEGARLPKVQVERAVAPILGVFLESVLTRTLHEKGCLPAHRRVIELCPEFPIRKGPLNGSDKNLSTNIDWLMLIEGGPEAPELLFFELKTTDTSFDAEQAGRYVQLVSMIASEGAGFLVDDITRIRDASDEYGKYERVHEKIAPHAERLHACRAGRVVYLAPAISHRSARPKADRSVLWLSFSDLASRIDHQHAAHWEVIRECLRTLDDVNRSSRNNPSGIAGRRNYDEQVSYADILEVCRNRRDEVRVGFEGGVAALRNTPPDQLKARKYKWAAIDQNGGSRKPGNWISGEAFLKEIEHLIATERPGLR